MLFNSSLLLLSDWDLFLRPPQAIFDTKRPKTNPTISEAMQEVTEAKARVFSLKSFSESFCWKSESIDSRFGKTEKLVNCLKSHNKNVSDV